MKSPTTRRRGNATRISARLSVMEAETTPRPPETPTTHPKPPLKWAGGKRWLVAHLEEIWTPFRERRFVEPLCGGLAVALGLGPQRALLNDVNPHLINFYRWLQRGLTADIPMENDSELYYAHRRRFNDLLRSGKAESRWAAELFYFLNRTGFNGLCRFNRKGEFNVPFGRFKRITYRRDFTEYKRALSGWTFTAVSFDELSLLPGDFVYADPPYDVPFTQYSAGGFEWEQQVRLAEWLARHPGPVALSNQATDRIVDLYRKLGFELTFLSAPRMISRTGDRTPAKEVLALHGM
jgi:DNA adenine methylase